MTIGLTESEARSSADTAFYHVHGSSVFDLLVIDAAGNSLTREFTVVYDPNAPAAELPGATDQAGYQYSPSQISTPVNMSEGTLTASIPVDIRDWCLRISALNSLHQSEQCESEQMIPQAVLEDEPGQTSVTAQYQIDTTELPDGDYLISLEMTDWANNTATQEWPLALDRTVPIAEWEISPGTAGAFFDHRQVLSWLSSEEVYVRFTIDGVLVSERTATTSGELFELNRTGMHEVCMEAVDLTEPQENDNRFVECRSMLLDASIYSTHVTAGWDGGLMAVDQVEAILQRGPDQEIWWSRHGSDDRYLIEPGASVVAITFDLVEGENQFLVEIHALDHVDEYTLSIVRDTTPPVLSFSEVTNRTTSLAITRVVSGICERGATVMLWTEVESVELVCDQSEQFEVHIAIPESPSTHVIDGLTVDAANNQHTHSIEVVGQEWIDWAIEDARNSGPMLWWFSLSAIAILLAIAVPTRVLRRRRARREMIEKQGPDLDTIISEIEESGEPITAGLDDEQAE